MEKTTVEFTHYGWFGICPAMFAEIDSGCPYIEPRFKLLPLMVFSEWLIGLYLSFKASSNSDFEPMFPLAIKGKFNKPVVKEFLINESC